MSAIEHDPDVVRCGTAATGAASAPWSRVPPSRAMIRGRWLLSGAAAAVGHTLRQPCSEAREELERRIRVRFEARSVHLVDSGTSALTLALSIAFAGRGGRRVALPAYTCYSVATAAAGAQGEVLLYDLDPHTLSPVPSSVEAVLRRGVDVLVVSPLYGYPIDIGAITGLAEQYGVTLVEDAAQAGGATFQGRPPGSFTPLSVLSFGRGKGLTCGGGGALLVRDGALERPARERLRDLPPGGAGWASLLAATGEWGFGRPALYGVPSAIPFLALGETRYEAPWPPRGLQRAPAALLRAALEEEVEDTQATERRRRAESLRLRLSGLPGVEAVRTVPGAISGELRLPLLLSGRAGRGAPKLGVMPAYPTTLAGIEAFRPAVQNADDPLPGATRLVRSLVTAPTHGWVPRDLGARLERWARERTARDTDDSFESDAITGVPAGTR